MDKDETIAALQARIEALEAGHNRNRDRIKSGTSIAKAALATMAFSAIVFGLPIAEMKWQGRDNFSITRDTASPELVIAGALAAAAIFVDGNPSEIIKLILRRKD